MMEVKHTYQPPSKVKHNQKRPGDWYCPVCGNFNFSFRVKCNRCTTQWRDDPTTQLYQHQEAPQLTSQESATSDKSKSTHDNSEDELELIKSPFQQALFVHDLLADEPPFQSLDFEFYRSCKECRKTCYFYQLRGEECAECHP